MLQEYKVLLHLVRHNGIWSLGKKRSYLFIFILKSILIVFLFLLCCAHNVDKDTLTILAEESVKFVKDFYG